jgi:hypothetical protein
MRDDCAFPRASQEVFGRGGCFARRILVANCGGKPVPAGIVGRPEMSGAQHHSARSSLRRIRMVAVLCSRVPMNWRTDDPAPLWVHTGGAGPTAWTVPEGLFRNRGGKIVAAELRGPREHAADLSTITPLAMKGNSSAAGPVPASAVPFSAVPVSAGV